MSLRQGGVFYFNVVDTFPILLLQYVEFSLVKLAAFCLQRKVIEF